MLWARVRDQWKITSVKRRERPSLPFMHCHLRQMGKRWSVTGETNIRALHNTVRGHGAGLESQRSLAPPSPRGARRTLRQHGRNAARSSASLTLSPLRPERRCGRVRGRQWAGSSPLAGICGPRSGPNLALGFQIHTSKGPGRAPARTPPGLARKCSMYMPCAQLRRLSTRRRAHMADAFIARVEGEYCDRPVRRGAPTAGSLPCCGARRGSWVPAPRVQRRSGAS